MQPGPDSRPIAGKRSRAIVRNAAVPHPTLAGKLTARELRYCLEYLVDFNQRQAAIRAGYPVRTAAARASELMGRGNVSAYLEKAISVRIQKLDQDGQRLLLELARMAHADVGQAFDSEGVFKPLADMHEDIRRCISSIQTEEYYELYDPENDKTSRVSSENYVPDTTRDGKYVTLARVVVRKIKFWDKTKAADTLAKCLRLYKPGDGANVNVQINLENLVMQSIPQTQGSAPAGTRTGHPPPIEHAAPEPVPSAVDQPRDGAQLDGRQAGRLDSSADSA